MVVPPWHVIKFERCFEFLGFYIHRRDKNKLAKNQRDAGSDKCLKIRSGQKFQVVEELSDLQRT